MSRTEKPWGLSQSKADGICSAEEEVNVRFNESHEQ